MHEFFQSPSSSLRAYSLTEHVGESCVEDDTPRHRCSLLKISLAMPFITEFLWKKENNYISFMIIIAHLVQY